MNSFLDYAFYFFLYGLIGWIMEVAFAFYVEHKFVNRGFLNGPICPMYGVGAVIFIFIGKYTSNSFVLTFLMSALAASILEYITGFLLEKIFNKRYWDYSDSPGNINGYISPLWSVLWGVGGVAEIFLIHPFVRSFTSKIPDLLHNIILIVAAVFFITDVVYTVLQHFDLDSKIKELEKLSLEITRVIKDKTASDKLEKEYEKVLRKRIKGEKRIFDAFPNINSKKYDKGLYAIKEWQKIFALNIQKAKDEYKRIKKAAKVQKDQKKLLKEAEKGIELNTSINKKKLVKTKYKQKLSEAKTAYRIAIEKIKNNDWD